MENAEEENKEEERTSMCAKNTESTRMSRTVLMFRITEMTSGNSQKIFMKNITRCLHFIR